MSNPTQIKRREFVANTSKASLAFAIPTIIPATALGLGGTTPPSDKIQLGVIGMGRRCKYVMAEILKLEDVRCRVIADVQASRREEAKKIVDEEANRIKSRPQRTDWA